VLEVTQTQNGLDLYCDMTRIK